MANTPDFVNHALDLVSTVGPVQARAMFGGHGIYARGVMFCLLDDDELFLKTDDASRPRFVEAGCRQWVWVSRTHRMESTGWFRPPDEAHEDPEAMAAWAALALESAMRRQAAKAKGGARRSKPRARRARPAAVAAGKNAPAPRSGKRAGRRTKAHAAGSRRRARPR